MPVIVSNGREAKIHLDKHGLYCREPLSLPFLPKQGGRSPDLGLKLLSPEGQQVSETWSETSFFVKTIVATVLKHRYSQFKKLYRKNDFLTILFKYNRPQRPC